MKVLAAIVVFAVVLAQTWDQAEPAPGFMSMARGVFGSIGRGIKTVATKVNIVSGFNKVGNYFPKIFKSFKRMTGHGAKQILYKTRNFGRKVLPRQKQRFLDGMALSSRYIKNKFSSFKGWTKNAYRKIFRKGKKPDQTGDLGAKTDPMAKDLNLPYDSNGKPISGGPGSPKDSPLESIDVATADGSPPKKKTNWGAIGLGIGQTVSLGLQTASSATGIAMQVKSMQAMDTMANREQTSQASGPGPSTSAAVTIGDNCEAVPNFFPPKSKECVLLSSDEENEDEITTKKMTWGTLQLQVEDCKKSGGGSTRRTVINLSDSRSSYVQAFQTIDVKNIKDTPIFQNRESALACADDPKLPIPLSALKANVPRPHAPGNLPPIPEVICKGKMVLAWTGLFNNVGGSITNTCHMDSFFTHILIKGRQDFSFFSRNFLLPQDGSEGLIKQIASEYNSLYSKATKNAVRDAHLRWKKIWVQTATFEYAQLMEKNIRVDFKGHEADSIFYRLEKSNIKIFTITCACDGHKSIVAKQVSMYAFSIEEVRSLSRADQTNAQHDNPLVAPFNSVRFKWCRKCSNYEVNYVFVPATTWMLYFLLLPNSLVSEFSKENSNVVPYQFDLNLVPKTFTAHELFFEKTVEFELAYISLATTKKRVAVFHHLSLHFLNDKFYFYDDMVSLRADEGLLTLMDNPNEIIKSLDLTIESVIYFRP